MRKFLAAAVLLTLLATALTVSGAPGSGASATTTPSGTAPITPAIGTVGGNFLDGIPDSDPPRLRRRDGE